MKKGIEFRPRFYKALYLTDLKFTSISHYPKSKRLFFIVDSDGIALFNLEHFLCYYFEQPFIPYSEINEPEIGNWIKDLEPNVT